MEDSNDFFAECVMMDEGCPNFTPAPESPESGTDADGIGESDDEDDEAVTRHGVGVFFVMPTVGYVAMNSDRQAAHPVFGRRVITMTGRYVCPVLIELVTAVTAAVAAASFVL